MVQREWVEKDFYKVLGVSSDAERRRDQAGRRKLLAENHPDRNPNNPAAEERYKAVGEATGRAARQGQAQGVRRDPPDVRRRRLRTSVRRRRRRWRLAADSAATAAARIQPQRPVRPGRRRTAAPTSATCSADCSAAVPSTAAHPAAPRQGSGDRDRTRLPGGHQGRGDAAAADQPGAVHQLPRQRCAPGHQPQGVCRAATARA